MTAAKKKPKRFSKVTAVKSAARNVVGAPPVTRAVPGKKERIESKAGKHKKTLQDLIEE